MLLTTTENNLKPAETIYCIPAEWCDQYIPAGVSTWPNISLTILEDAPSVLVEKSEAEGRDDVVQLATYAILRCDDRVLCYARGGGGGEGGLHYRMSVGVGGHVEASDFWTNNLFFRALQSAALREVREELVIASNITSFRFAGYIRNRDDAVGRRHLGLLYEATLDGRVVKSREPDKIVGPVFMTIPTLAGQQYLYLERWSQLVVGHLAGSGRKEGS